MSFIVPLPTKERLKQSSRAKKSKGKKEKVARGVKQNRFVKAKYNRELQKITNELIIQTKSELVESLRRLEPEYIQDNYAEVLGNILFTLTNRWRNITRHAKLISAEMVNGINDKNRKMFYKSLQNATGVSLNGIISEEGLQPMLTSSINENVSLIQSIPDEYFKKLNTIINEGTKRGKSSGGIIKDILSLGKSTKKRAKLIARDQTQKVNAAITQGRQNNLGVTEYIWRTSSDERVRESHKSKNGKRFRWDKPPADTGHPGQDIQCRCVAEPVIELN